MFGLRLPDYGLWLTAYGSRLTAYSLRLTAYVLWLTAYCLRRTAYGLRLTVCGLRSLLTALRRANICRSTARRTPNLERFLIQYIRYVRVCVFCVSLSSPKLKDWTLLLCPVRRSLFCSHVGYGFMSVEMIDKPGASSPMCEARLWGFRRVSGTRAPLFGHEGTDVAKQKQQHPLWHELRRCRWSFILWVVGAREVWLFYPPGCRRLCMLVQSVSVTR